MSFRWWRCESLAHPLVAPLSVFLTVVGGSWYLSKPRCGSAGAHIVVVGLVSDFPYRLIEQPGDPV